jgi:hypothetical protein
MLTQGVMKVRPFVAEKKQKPTNLPLSYSLKDA